MSEENVMKRDVAVWIDHREAVIAAISGEVEATSRLESNIEKRVRFLSGEGGAEDQRDKRYANHLREYYDAVVSRIGDADAILLLGPGARRSPRHRYARAGSYRRRPLHRAQRCDSADADFRPGAASRRARVRGVLPQAPRRVLHASHTGCGRTVSGISRRGFSPAALLSRKWSRQERSVAGASSPTL